MEKLMPRVAHGKYVLLPITPETRGHGTHSWPVDLAGILEGVARRDGKTDGGSLTEAVGLRLRLSLTPDALRLAPGVRRRT